MKNLAFIQPDPSAGGAPVHLGALLGETLFKPVFGAMGAFQPYSSAV